MTLCDFAAVLVASGIPTMHETATDTPGSQYIVWQEYHTRRQKGGVLLIVHIQVDFYTKRELDPALDKLLAALESADVFFSEPDSSYDPTTGYARHMIECEIVSSRAERMENK